MSPSSTSSLLALVQLAAPALVAVVALLWILVAIAVYSWVIRPIVEWLSRPRGGFFKRIVFWPIRKATEAVDGLMREQIAAMSRWAAANTVPAVIMFAQLAEVVERIAGTLGDMSEQIYTALWKLNHETIPRKIEAALLPVRNRLDRIAERANALEELNQGVAVIFGDLLRELPWGAPGGYLTNIATFADRFVQLWRHYWNTTRAELNALLAETIPELRRDVADLARRLDVQIDARFDALAARVGDLERQAAQMILPRLDNLEAALDALAREVFGEVGTGLVELVGRVTAIEDAIANVIEARLTDLEAGLAQLRLDLEEGVRTGLAAFGERLEAVELAIGTLIPAQIEAMQLAIDALAAEVFGEVGEGLAALTARIVAIEQTIQDRILPGFDLIIGRIDALEDRIQNVILPRLEGIEALLAPAAFAALVLATMRTVAPNLFCRNVTRTSEALCAADPGLVDDLLAFLIPPLILADLCGFARLMREAAGPLVSVLSPIVLGAADLVECRGAGAPVALPLNTTALPAPTQALAL